MIQNKAIRLSIPTVTDAIDHLNAATTQALVYLLHIMLAVLDVGHCFVRLFFADSRKGFDLVDHNILIDELEHLNVHPVVIRWTRSFLTNREQCVRIGRCTSSWKTASGGLPQRTKLGSILFAILVNPLLKDWPTSNRGMELNHKKCKEMVISFLKYDIARLNPIYVSGFPVQ